MTIMFNQCRLRDRLGWNRVSWIAIGAAKPNARVTLPVARLGPREYVVQSVYQPPLPEDIFKSTQPVSR
jgi:hypothetical protein